VYKKYTTHTAQTIVVTLQQYCGNIAMLQQYCCNVTTMVCAVWEKIYMTNIITIFSLYHTIKEIEEKHYSFKC